MATDSQRTWYAYLWLLLANLGSLIVFWRAGWPAHGALVVYWLEAGVVSAVYVAKIQRAEGADEAEHVRSWATFDREPADRLLGKPNRTVAGAVITTFAGPWLVWGVITVLAGLHEALPFADPVPVGVATASLVAYQLGSYWYEYVGHREYERRGPVSLYVELAPRHLAVVLTCLFGAGLATSTGQPAAAIVVLVTSKTCVDLVAVRRELTLAEA